MRILDLLRMSSANLWKRKVRTLLTILGVVIGTASIVVMVSLGLGLNKATMEDIEQYGGLTTIEVREGRGDSSSYTTYSIGGGGSVTFSSDSGSSSSKDKVMRLDDAAVSLLESLDHVENVYPVLQLNIVAKYGQYVDDYMTIQGMTPEGLQALNIEIGDGNLPLDDKELQFFFGNRVAADFYNPRTYEYPYYDLFYSVLKVNVDDIDNMIAVQEQIQALGYEASSNIEWIESTQKQYANIQAMLGGIGAISLLVAAIGITNTMMMSIYERTKEIGVMKVLGCDMRNIQAMFLMEAADIGLVGGIVGLGISYLISMIINKVVAASGNMSSLSYIPLWLAGASVIFAVVIGMAAGYFPSKRAMKLSPLAAIRNE